MDRLTEKYRGDNRYYMVCSETCVSDMDCIDCLTHDRLVERLAVYEDTGYMPEEIAKLQGDLIQRNAELLKARQKIKDLHNCIGQLDSCVEQLDALNDGLMASNEKLAADRKALINELCQYCGKYKHAHEGACDGCRWGEK